MKRTALIGLTAAGLMLAGPALAQTKPPAQTPPSDSVGALLDQKPGVNDGEAYHRAPDSEQNPAEVRTTQALNDEIAQRNQLAENQEAADQAAFEQERARYEATVADLNQQQLAYEESVRQANAAERAWREDVARSEAARRQWEADVQACRAGDRSRCAPN